MFRDSLIITLESNDKKRTVNQFSNDEMIKRQKEELKALEIEEANKKKKEREEMEKAKRVEQEKIKQEQIKVELSKKKKNSLKPEPNANDPNSALIVFRYPDFVTRVERRFLKTEKVQVTSQN